MKSIQKILVILSFAALTSCNFTDPVEYNDNIVAKMDSLVNYQAEFVESLGKEGDTMKNAYATMNKYADNTITKINKMPEYSNGEEFRKSVVQIINNLKATNVSSGNGMMELYDKANSGAEITDADYEKIDQLATDFDTSWEKEIKNFDEAQKKYAEKTGITIQQVGNVLKK